MNNITCKTKKNNKKTKKSLNNSPLPIIPPLKNNRNSTQAANFYAYNDVIQNVDRPLGYEADIIGYKPQKRGNGLYKVATINNKFMTKEDYNVGLKNFRQQQEAKKNIDCVPKKQTISEISKGKNVNEIAISYGTKVDILTYPHAIQFNRSTLKGVSKQTMRERISARNLPEEEKRAREVRSVQELMRKRKNRIKRLIECNYDSRMKSSQLFVTLTFRESQRKTKDDISKINHEVSLFIRRLNYFIDFKYPERQGTFTNVKGEKQNYNFKRYIYISEKNTDNESMHVHLIFFNAPFIRPEEMQKLWKLGALDVGPIRSKDAVIQYITKSFSRRYTYEEIPSLPTGAVMVTSTNLIQPELYIGYRCGDLAKALVRSDEELVQVNQFEYESKIGIGTEVCRQYEVRKKNIGAQYMTRAEKEQFAEAHRKRLEQNSHTISVPISKN